MRSKILLTLALAAAVVAGTLAISTHKAQQSPYDVEAPPGYTMAPLPEWVKDAEAQSAAPYARLGTSSVATVVVAAFSDTAGVIPDGTVVISDTTSSVPGLKRFGVSPWAGTAITRARILGIAMGNIPTRSSGTAGRVLIMGYHANAKMGASGLTGNLNVKTAVGVNGALTTVVDSLSGSCGIFLGGASNATAANYRGRVIITSPLGKFFGSL